MPVAVALSVAALCILLGLPLLSLFVRVPLAEVWRRLGDRTVLDALGLSLRTTLVATILVILIGLPTAWLFAYRSFPGKRIAEALLELPIVLPPTVAGLEGAVEHAIFAGDKVRLSFKVNWLSSDARRLIDEVVAGSAEPPGRKWT